MSEAGFSLFMNIVAGIEIFMYAVCMTFFFYLFMTEKKEQSKSRIKKVLMVFLIYTVLYFIGMAAFVYGWLCMIIVLILLVAASKFLDMDKEFTFFLGVIFFCTRDLSMLAMESIDFLSSGYFAEKEETVEYIFRNAALNYVFVAVLQLILFSVMLYAAARLLKKKTLKLHIKELCYLLLTPITGILFGNIIFRLLIVVKNNLVFQLYEQFPVFLGIMPVVAALFYAGILITIVSYQKMIGLQEEKEKYFVEQQQVHAIQERMEEVEQFYNGIRQMKHEMKNHLTNIKGLVRNGSYGDIEQYIDHMDESMNVFELTIKTGNTVTDVIVNDKQKAAEKQEIQFQSEFSYPKSDGYNAYDIGVIINNLLQNALEACGKMAEGKRYIYLSGRQKKKFYVINVKNSFEGEVTFDTKTNLPLSTKGKDTALHGIGLSNVKREADKYMGDVDIRAKKNEFSVTVLLQERRKI